MATEEPQRLAARGNRLLNRLPEVDYRRLLPLLKPVKLAFKQVLYQFGSPIEFAYFPIGAVTSALTVMRDGSAIEVATVGNEGLVGHTAAFGGARTSPNKVIVQIGDGGLRIEAQALRAEAERSGAQRAAGRLPERLHRAGLAVSSLQRTPSP